MIFVNFPLARRIEAVEAALARSMAREVLEVAGGVAAFVSPESPLSHALGLGMNGPLDGVGLNRIEDFYRSRGAPVTIELCPMADQSVPDLVTSRGYGITEFANLLLRRIQESAEVPQSTVHVFEAEEQDCESWAEVAARGFFGREPAGESELEIGRSIFRAASVRAWFAELDGQRAGVGASAIIDGVASLFADSTLPAFRCRGVQLSLIRARLAAARSQGADFAIASTAPGSVSQRNYQRCGFEPAYTRPTFQAA